MVNEASDWLRSVWSNSPSKSSLRVAIRPPCHDRRGCAAAAPVDRTRRSPVHRWPAGSPALPPAAVTMDLRRTRNGWEEGIATTSDTGEKLSLLAKPIGSYAPGRQTKSVCWKGGWTLPGVTHMLAAARPLARQAPFRDSHHTVPRSFRASPTKGLTVRVSGSAI